MSRKPRAESTRPRHATFAVVLQVRDGRLQVLLWQRARDPFREAWALPGGLLEPGETLEESIRRHLAAKVDVREISHLEQLATYSDPSRDPTAWELATAYLGLVAARPRPARPRRHALASRRRPSPHRLRPRRDRARRPRATARASSRTRTPGSRSRPPSVHARRAARGLRRGARPRGLGDEPPSACSSAGPCIEPTGERRPSGRAGGRPAEVFRFRDRRPCDHRPVRRPPAAALSEDQRHTGSSADTRATARTASPTQNPTERVSASAATASVSASERSTGSR